jgi:hypothetical protein
LLPTHIGHLARHHLVTALLRLTHHRKRGVLVNFEGLEGVGNEQDFHNWDCMVLALFPLSFGCLAMSGVRDFGGTFY